MKNLAFFIAIFLFLTCATSRVAARYLDSIPTLRNEKLQCWYYHHVPHFHPKPHWPFPTAGKAFPPLPAGHSHPISFHPPPVVTKCLADCKDVRTCFVDIAKTFFTQKASIGSHCCTSILKMEEDCEKTVFGVFHNPFFDCIVKLHCSTKTGSISSAPSPA